MKVALESLLSHSERPPDSAHLRDEEVAAVLERGFTAVGAARQAHLSDCPDCTSLLSVAFGSLGDERSYEAFPVRPSAWQRVSYWTAASLVAASLVAAFMWRGGVRDRRSRALQPLVEATRIERVVEARMAGGFQGAPLASILRSSVAPERDDYEASRLVAAAQVEQAARTLPTAEAEALRGAALLASGRFERGLTVLRQAAALSPGDRRVISDLSAALLERARRFDDARDAAEALDLILRLLDSHPGFPEALFNKGVALSRLGREEEARAAFRAYLLVDADSSWAFEARRRAQGRMEPSSGSSRGRDPTRVGSGSLLSRWAVLVHDGMREEAEAALDSMSREAASKDPLLAATVAAVRRLPHGDLPYLANVVKSAMIASAEESVGRWVEAREHWTAASDGLKAKGVPLHLAWRLRAVACAIQTTRTVPIGGVLEDVADAADRAGYLDVEIRAHWLIGLVSAIEGRYGPAADSYQTARLQAQAAEDPPAVAALDGLMAEVLDLLGDSVEAWRCRVRGLRGQWALSSGKAHAAHHEAARAARASGWYRLALDFLSAGEAYAKQAGPAATAEVHIERAAVLALLGRSAASERELRFAAVDVRAVPDRGRQNFLQGLMSELRADRTARAFPRTALDASNSARSESFRKKDLRMSRAVALLGAGDATAARVEAATALRYFEEELSTAGGHGLYQLARASRFLEDARRVLHPFPSGSELATFLERFRGRDVLSASGLRGIGSRTPMTARDLRSLLPPGDAVVWISLEETRLEVIQMDASGLTVASREVDARAVEDEIAGFRRALRNRDVSERRMRSDRLVSMLEPAFMGAAGRVVVVPDGPFWLLPIGALTVDGSTVAGARYGLVVSPSATLALGQRPVTPRSTARTLIVGDAARGLARLPKAAEESRVVARIFGVDPLIGDRARRTPVLERLAASDVVIFATHATNAGRGGTIPLWDGDLTEADVRSIAMRPGAVVILSACDAGSGELVRGEGPRSLARAFLSAGAGHVLAAARPLADDYDRSLIEGFERRIASGRPVVDAWREAVAAEPDPAGSLGDWILLGSLDPP